ncbi:hypothetical protein ACWDUL_39910 [Nocardia niigatensis]|uniref:hypothetical protein n=1 Tax=Nocardia niigatensis TaxID=209249 RepID=UPI00031D300C|nr:hypothetical protein [Nocardia niigatensis]
MAGRADSILAEETTRALAGVPHAQFAIAHDVVTTMLRTGAEVSDSETTRS